MKLIHFQSARREAPPASETSSNLVLAAFAPTYDHQLAFSQLTTSQHHSTQQHIITAQRNDNIITHDAPHAAQVADQPLAT